MTRFQQNGRDYRVKEKLSTGQTLDMFFECIDEYKGTLYYNISLSVYSKRKHAYKNEDEKKITGKNPVETVLAARRIFYEIEGCIIDDCKAEGLDVVFEVFWTDNRRRDAYYKVLSRDGYRYGMRGDVKCLEKRVFHNE